MNINARGNLLCVRAQISAMRKQELKTWTSRNGTRDIGRGVIVNIASANSYVGLPGKGSYTIFKHAFMAITKMACKCQDPKMNRNLPSQNGIADDLEAMDHCPEGIRVNAVCPTWVCTPLLDEELKKNPEVQGYDFRRHSHQACG